jgi:hypothetical protein
VGLSRAWKIVAPLALLPVVLGGADVAYGERSALSHTQYAIVENFGEEQITAEQVDTLLEEIAEILDVTLLPSTPEVRIMVMSSARIADLYRQSAMVAPHGADARALYLPGANLVAISHYGRMVLGHELAHDLPDQYLKLSPRRNWERIAVMVEDALPSTPRIKARRTPGADVAATRALLAPPAAAN